MLKRNDALSLSELVNVSVFHGSEGFLMISIFSQAKVKIKSNYNLMLANVNGLYEKSRTSTVTFAVGQPGMLSSGHRIKLLDISHSQEWQ